MRVCIVIPFILDVRLVDAPAGVTQEEGHTGFLHLPSAVLIPLDTVIVAYAYNCACPWFMLYITAHK